MLRLVRQIWYLWFQAVYPAACEHFRHCQQVLARVCLSAYASKVVFAQASILGIGLHMTVKGVYIILVKSVYRCSFPGAVRHWFLCIAAVINTTMRCCALDEFCVRHAPVIPLRYCCGLLTAHIMVQAEACNCEYLCMHCPMNSLRMVHATLCLGCCTACSCMPHVCLCSCPHDVLVSSWCTAAQLAYVLQCFQTS